VDDIAVLHQVVLTLEPELSGFFAFGFTAIEDKLIVGYDLGSDKAAFDVAVNFSGSFLCHRPLGDRPGAHFVFTRCEKT
jgi:hypothetical protein